jgi:hypothetical protein
MAPLGGNAEPFGGKRRAVWGEASALGYAGHGLMSDCATVWQSAA